MGSGGSSSQSQAPGTLSPVSGTLLDLFGGNVGAFGGQLAPTSFNRGGAFNTGQFAALPGLLANQPLTSAEQFILGAGGTPTTTRSVFDQEGFEAATQQAAGGLLPGAKGGGGQLPAVGDFLTTEVVPGGQAFGQEGGFQDLALADAFAGRGALLQGLETLPALLETDPTASIAAARRGFTEETLPAILERAPGFSSSDLQREVTRAGTDLETDIAALREANLGRVAQTVQGLPEFASAVGTQLLDRASDVLGFGQLGREFIREQSPAGDAFRVLTALQSLTGPSLTSVGSGESKNLGILS